MSKKHLKSFQKWPLINCGAPPNHSGDSQRSPKQVPKNVPSMSTKWATLVTKLDQEMSNILSNICAYLWMIFRYLWLLMDYPEASIDYPWKIRKTSVFFLWLPPAAFSTENTSCCWTEKPQKRESWKRKRRAPHNDSDPFTSNQFFFNFRKQSNYEKTHGRKLYGYLWVIHCGGWVGGGVMWQTPPPPKASYMRRPEIKNCF